MVVNLIPTPSSIPLVIFPHFNFKENCKVKTKHVPEDIISWEDKVPRVALSVDNVPFAVYLPMAIKSAGQVRPFLSTADHVH